MRLSLQGSYKGLKDQAFDFSAATGNVAALIGLNGSGKSQLLELIVESFAYLERKKRRDFKARRTMPFDVTIEYEEQSDRLTRIETYQVSFGLEAGIQSRRLQGGEWTGISFEELPLPLQIIGYSSGSNENLQRGFLKNAVQYFDVMQVRANRRSHLAKREREDHPIIEGYFRRRYRGIFPDVDPYGMLIERDTPLPAGIFLDYDCCALILASLAVLPQREMDVLVRELPFKHIAAFSIRFNLSEVPVEEDSIKDIQLLIEIAGGIAPGPSRRSGNDEYERLGLEYISATIRFDLENPELRRRLVEAHYGSPLAIFRKLYRLQLLGISKLQARDKQLLRQDSFFGNVKKPLKLRPTVEVQDIRLTDGHTVVDFDDLSDGETQLVQVLGAARIFRDERTLFIFDEPDTHLNPHWRTHFHQHLTEALATGLEDKNTQVLVSAHSSFMVSSLRKQNVFQFEKQEGRTSMHSVVGQTFGASFEVLTKRFFGLNSLISQTAVAEIQAVLEKGNRTEALTWIEANLGDSMEKAYLLRKLQSDAAAD